ncbi:MAG: hypothetical protein U0229_07470 [Anaeromyxobacter sp.]
MDGLRQAWIDRPPVTRTLAILLLLSLVAAGAWSVAAPALAARRLPTPLEWAAARALLERDSRPGDAVAIEPAWAERAREVLPAAVPVVPAAAVAGGDLPGVKRLWVVSLSGVRGARPGVETLVGPRAVEGQRVALGRLAVARLDLVDPVLPLAFLPDRAGALTVKLGDAACAPTAAGFSCGPGGPRVERTLREVAGAARPCLSISPAGPLPAPLALAFRDAPVGRWLRGHAGVADGPAGQVGISVVVDGEAIGGTEVATAGWTAFRVDTARLAGPAREVALVLTAAAPVGDLCLDAVTTP